MHPYLISAFVSYLLGSIPFGYLLVRIFRGEDVRAGGSGNIGATNVARKSPALGVATLLLDAAKGLAAVVLARTLLSGPHPQLIMTTAAFFAVLGHLFPVWLRFHGGKGVATSLGAFVLLTPKSILCMVGLFLLITAAFRYVSLGSVAAAIAFPVLAWAFHEYTDPRQLALMAAVSALVIWKHRKNIGRLAAGTEARLRSKATRKIDRESGTLGARQ
ncbi:MAG: glycerol-3-phosphate 1-O-acyltransferase PlsY [Terriglobales bacterium]|jgi:glycerol-3-phosphate acyltransferase PlsY